MIRHGRSFFFSLSIHVIVFALIIFMWKNYDATEKIEQEKVCLKLCNVETPQKQPEVKEPHPIQNIPQENPKKSQELKKPVPKEIIKTEMKPMEKMLQNEEQNIPQEIPVTDKIITKDNVVQKEEVQQKPEAPQEKYTQLNTQKIAQLIQENLFYPISARRKGISGLVVIKFSLNIDAKISNIEIVESSSEVLSRAAIQTIEELSGKFPKPEKEVNLSIPINYSLN